MHPLKVITYYYRASRTFEQNYITITTVVTFNRFKDFSGYAIVFVLNLSLNRTSRRKFASGSFLG